MDDNTILIWGAGAIGGTLGAYFARAGEDVLLVDIVEAHVDAVNQQGLVIEGPVEAFTQKMRALTPNAVQGKYRRVILAVKAHHTAGAVRALKPHLADDGSVLSAQNGLNELVIAQEIGQHRTVGCFVNFGADWLEPGRILFGNRATVALGELDVHSRSGDLNHTPDFCICICACIHVFCPKAFIRPRRRPRH